MIYKFSKIFHWQKPVYSGDGNQHENIPNWHLAEESHKPITRKQTAQSSFIANDWCSDLGIIKLISKFKGICFLLQVVDVYKK